MWNTFERTLARTFAVVYWLTGAVYVITYTRPNPITGGIMALFTGLYLWRMYDESDSGIPTRPR